jgi:hypothetical protein
LQLHPQAELRPCSLLLLLLLPVLLLWRSWRLQAMLLLLLPGQGVQAL